MYPHLSSGGMGSWLMDSRKMQTLTKLKRIVILVAECFKTWALEYQYYSLREKVALSLFKMTW